MEVEGGRIRLGRRWRRLIKINHKSSFLAAGVGWYEEAVLWSGPEFVDRFFFFILSDLVFEK